MAEGGGRMCMGEKGARLIDFNTESSTAGQKGSSRGLPSERKACSQVSAVSREKRSRLPQCCTRMATIGS